MTMRHVFASVRRASKRVSGPALAILLTACVVSSPRPLTPLSESRLDAGILGTWMWNGTNEIVFVHIGRGQIENEFTILTVERGNEDTLKTESYTGHVSKIGDKRYLNIKWKDCGRNDCGYLFVRYKYKGPDQLSFSTMDPDEARRAVRSGKIAGRVLGEKWNHEVILDDSAERLRRFISSNDEKLFHDFKDLTRITPARHPPGQGA